MIWIKRFLVLALIALVVIQFIPVDRNESGYETLDAFIAETKPSAEVQEILKASCYDCHSDQTIYPWYADVAPVNFWLASHIKDGKRHLNFSDWSQWNAKRKDHKLDETIEMIEEGEMPLVSYTLMHGDADLTADQKELLINWAKAARLQLSSAPQPQ